MGAYTFINADTFVSDRSKSISESFILSRQAHFPSPHIVLCTPFVFNKYLLASSMMPITGW